MDIKAKFMEDLKQAMRDKDTVKKDTLSLIRAAIKQYEVDNRQDATTEVIYDILSKQLKLRKDSLEQFQNADRQDLVDQTNEEIKIVKEYLPKQLEEPEIKEIINKIINQTNAKTMADMKVVMTEFKKDYSNNADGKLVSSIIKDLLSNN